MPRKLTPQDKRKAIILNYLKGLATHRYTYKQAMESTKLSKQWLIKLVKRYKEYGAVCLNHGNKNKVPVNKTSETIVQKILLLYSSDDYKDLNFANFHDCLAEYEGIFISYKTLRNILIAAGIQSPERRKIKHKKVHRLRIRRQQEGDMIQLDGTPYAWFYKFGDNKKYCMHGAIDDATGKITALYMAEYECLYGIMQLFKMTAKRFGIPREAYMDRAGWACASPKHKDSLSLVEQLAGVHEKRTQIQRALGELNVNQILAWSPQAKGRVERMWQPVQDRFPIWCKKRGINTIEKANARINEFIDWFNAKWAKPAAKSESAWQPVPDDLDDILCAQFPHVTNCNGCFKFHSYNFAVMNCEFVANKHFLLCITSDSIKALMPDGKYYPVKLLDPDIGDTVSDTAPQVVKTIIYQNMFSFAKEISA